MTSQKDLNQLMNSDKATQQEKEAALFLSQNFDQIDNQSTSIGEKITDKFGNRISTADVFFFSPNTDTQ